MVVVILGILMGIGIWRLWGIGTDRYNAERCVNKIYAHLSQFVWEAAASKIPEGQTEVPDAYIFDMIDDIPNNKRRAWDTRIITGINFLYKYWDNYHQGTTLYIHDIPWCEITSKYYILLETALWSGIMLPKLQGKGNQPGFLLENRENTHYDPRFDRFFAGFKRDISPWRVYTGELKFDFCTWEDRAIGLELNEAIKNRIGTNAWQNWIPSDLAKFTIDTRTGILKKSYCKISKNGHQTHQQLCNERYSN